MPSDVDLFNMLRDNILKSMNAEELVTELRRTWKMADAVQEYRRKIFRLIMTGRVET